MAFLGGFFFGGWEKDGRWLPFYLKVTPLEEEGAFLPLRKLSSFSWPFKNTYPFLEQNFANLRIFSIIPKFPQGMVHAYNFLKAE